MALPLVNPVQGLQQHVVRDLSNRKITAIDRMDDVSCLLGPASGARILVVDENVRIDDGDRYSAILGERSVFFTTGEVVRFDAATAH